MKFTWIERAPDWHQVDLGHATLTAGRKGLLWVAWIGAAIEEDRGEVLFLREHIENLDAAKRAAEELFEQNLPAILRAVARRAHNAAVDQCYALASHTSVVFEEQGDGEQARGAQAAARAFLGLRQSAEEPSE